MTSGATIALSLGLNAISGILSARLLGPSGKGSLALAFVWGSLVSQMAEVGLNQALTYHASIRPERTATLWAQSLVVAVTQSLVAVPLALVAAAGLVHSSASRTPVAVALLGVPLGLALGYELSLLRGAERFAAYNANRLGQALGWTVVVVAFATLSLRSALGLVVSYLAIQCLTLLSAAEVLRRLFGRPRFELRGVARVLRYGSLVWVAGIGYQTNFRVDQFILGIFVAAASLGQYATAVSLASGLTVISMGIAIVTLPAVARAAPAQRLKLGRRNWRIGVLLMIASSAVLWPFVPTLVELLLGPRFQPVAPLLRILLLGQVALGSTQILHDVARGQGRLGLPAVVESIGAVATIAALLFVVPRWGATGAAWVSVAVYWPVTGVLFWGILLKPRAQLPVEAAMAAGQVFGPEEQTPPL